MLAYYAVPTELTVKLIWVSDNMDQTYPACTVLGLLPAACLEGLEYFFRNLVWVNIIFGQGWQEPGLGSRQASDCASWAPNPLDSSTHDQSFYQDFEAP